jgi:hypothetical protein
MAGPGKRKNSNETQSKTHKELTPSCATAAIHQKIKNQRFVFYSYCLKISTEIE